MTGLFGKLPHLGDFIHRDLQQSFVLGWDKAVQAGLAVAHCTWGAAFETRWAACPAWRFGLPAGLCGEQALAGIWLPSMDAAGRRYPFVLAAPLGSQPTLPSRVWFEELELLASKARDYRLSVDQLVQALAAVQPVAQDGPSDLDSLALAVPQWWTSSGRRYETEALPNPAQFVALLSEPQAAVVKSLKVQSATDKGSMRSRNEDALMARDDIGLWAVADGAGGHGAGDVASAAITQSLVDMPAGLSAVEMLAQVRSRLAHVHSELRLRALSDPHGMNPMSTVVVALISEGHFACLWAGDSRAYLLRDGELRVVTRDHSVLQELIEAGCLEPEDAENHPQAHIITRAIGGDEELILDKVVGKLEGGDVLLLCTDGLFKALPEGVIADILTDGAGADELVARSLVSYARDNVTALVITVPV